MGHRQIDAALPFYQVRQLSAAGLRTARLANRHDCPGLHGHNRLHVEQRARRRAHRRDAAAAAQVFERIEQGKHPNVLLAHIELLHELGGAHALTQAAHGIPEQDLLADAYVFRVHNVHAAPFMQRELASGHESARARARQTRGDGEAHDLLAFCKRAPERLLEEAGRNLARRGLLLALGKPVVELLVREIDAVEIIVLAHAHMQRQKRRPCRHHLVAGNVAG